MAAISDRHKGIKPTLEESLPTTVGVPCTKHVLGNMHAAKLGSFSANLVWALQASDSAAAFQTNLQALKENNEKAATYIMDSVEVQNWAVGCVQAKGTLHPNPELL